MFFVITCDSVLQNMTHLCLFAACYILHMCLNRSATVKLGSSENARSTCVLGCGNAACKIKN